MPKHVNPFNEEADPKRHAVAELLLSGETVSWNDILNKVGSFSARTMGFVLRGLEDQEATILRLRDPEHGTLYRYDPMCTYDERFRLSKTTGTDANSGSKQEAEKS